MSRDIHRLAVGTFAPMLRNLSTWIDKAAAGRADPDALTAARLAPDMYDLAQQVELACRHAADTVARLTGRPPSPPTEAQDLASLARLQALIARTVSAVEAAPASGFAGAEDRDIRLPLNPQMEFRFSGERLLRDWGLPHFYFHLVTAYDILRHEGAAIGKQDYLAQVADAITPLGAP
ncbi:DUF1993 domain-containing protein [Caulobacter sp. KR2-114]|uniref:DUF1993 domain-containing protein n=1 Tax=Caulobacter sp. KR2-114 TaxID=3400912 RepID=UPI003C118A4A